MKRSILVGVGLACLTLLLAAETAQAQRWIGRRAYNRGIYAGGVGGGYYNQGWGGYYGRPFGYGGYGYGYPYLGNTGIYTGPGGYYTGASTFASTIPTMVSTPGMTTTQSYYAGPNQMPADPTVARIRVLLPKADAQVMFDGNATQETGTDRLFVTPSLPTGKDLYYTVQASWMENGQRVSREKRIQVRPGDNLTVDFQTPAG
jgi:uncharacterized protein (TIGR03000 family)